MTDPAWGPQAPGQDPTCPRHPDRVSYVRCQRCERPTCPECQRAAAVGIQCVDCVREGSRGVREARTAFGATLRRGRPVVTLTMIGICVVVYLFQASVAPGLPFFFGFRPFLAAAEPWRFLTAAFLHGQLLHIAFNLYAVWIFGSYLEQQFGRLRFAALYLLSAFGGSVGSLLLISPASEGWGGISVGASGAVFGLFGALVLVQRKLNQQFGQIVVLIVINGAIGFVLPNIAWQAHLGGLVTGLALGAVFAYAPQRARTPVQVAGAVAVAAVLVVAAVARMAATGLI
ncbi:Membrane associated serine protease, rhomboid family [Quadrisphaera granulorum]|uniref:Membrane associated rhomboid family serine protease n=1 Tax=Quadrisphaera granulorum TaxID=317664 RepID=A0A316AFK0_9ACTN|nr:rhomboid family intramembrane serine protease [Quadrisphaera granulorum]PWJ55750.1 membrane associated rhomboid family serine protease [Quadrisphaera granulorum]SZE95247.1 Membrane associated serine protease, rhomboid family [Quadrisphaera granulorum]